MSKIFKEDGRMSSEEVILDVINVLAIQNVPFSSFEELQSEEVLASFIKLIKKKDIPLDHDEVIDNLKNLINENFSAENSIVVNNAVNGDRVQLCILYILLIYICILADNNLRGKLSRAKFKLSTELKLKHLVESIHNRMTAQVKGQTLNQTYLEILVTEDLDFLVQSYGTPKNENNSARIYTSTPERTHNSPLKDFLQSPSFRIQQQLRDKDSQIRCLSLQVNKLEDDIRELVDTSEVLKKKFHSIECDRNRVSSDNVILRQHLDDAKSTSILDKNGMNEALVQCKKTIRDLEAENKRLNADSNIILEENVHLVQKLTKSSKENSLVMDENKRLIELADSLNEPNRNYEELVLDLKEKQKIIEDYHQWYEHCQNNKAMNKTIEESFECRTSLSMNSSITLLKDTSSLSGDGEHLGGIVEKMLSEQKLQVNELQQEKQHLLTQLSNSTKSIEIKEAMNKDVTAERDNLLTEVQSLSELRCQDKENLSRLTENHDSLLKEMQHVTHQLRNKEQNCTSLQTENISLMGELHLMKETVIQKEKKISELKEEYDVALQKVCDVDAVNQVKENQINDLRTQNTSMIDNISVITNSKIEAMNSVGTLKEDHAMLIKEMEKLKEREMEQSEQSKSLKMKLELEIGQLNNDMKLGSEEIHSLKAETARLIEMAASLESSNSEYISQCGALENIRSILEADVQKLNQEHKLNQSNVVAMEKKIDLLNTEIGLAEIENKTKDSKIKEFEIEKNVLSEKLVSITHKKDDNANCLSKLKHEYDLLTNQFQVQLDIVVQREQEFGEKCNELKNTKENFIMQIGAIKKDLKLKSEEIEGVKSENKELTENIQHTGQQLGYKESIISSLNVERNTLADEISSIRENLHKEKYRYSTLKEQYDLIIQKTDFLESKDAEFISQSKELKDLEAKVKIFTNDKDFKQNEIYSLEKQILTLNEQVTHAEIENATKDNKIGEFEIEKSVLLQKLVSMTDSRNNNLKCISKLKQEYDLFTDEVKLAEKSKSECVAQCEHLKAVNSKMEQQMMDCRTEYELSSDNVLSLKTENELLVQKIAEVDGKWADKYQQIECLKSEKNSLSQQVTSLTKNITDSETSLSKLQVNYDALDIQVKKMDAEVKVKDDEINELRTETTSLAEQILCFADCKKENDSILSNLIEKYDAVQNKLSLTEIRESEYIVQCEEFISIREIMKAEMDCISKQLSLESQQVNTLKNENKLLIEQTHDLLESKKKITDDNDAFLKDVNQKMEEYNVLHCQYDTKEIEIKRINDKFSLSSNKVLSLEKSLSDSLENCNNIEKENCKLRTDVEKMMKDASNYENKIISMERDLQNFIPKAIILEKNESEYDIKNEKLSNEKNSMIEVMQKLKMDNAAAHDEKDTLENKVKMLSEKLDVVKNQDFEHRLKYENALGKNQDYLEQIINLKDEKDIVRLEITSLKEENRLISTKRINLQTEVIKFSQENDVLLTKCEEFKTEVETFEKISINDRQTISAMQNEVIELKSNLDKNKQMMHGIEVGAVNKQKETLLAKKDCMKVEREHKLIVDHIKCQLASSNDEVLKEKKKNEKMKTSYRSQLEGIMKELEGYGEEQEKALILEQKYHALKKKLGQNEKELDMANSHSKTMENKVEKLQYELSIHSTKENMLFEKVQTLQEERQPILSKLTEAESKLRHIVTENNSLQVQLQSAETAIQSMKVDSSRYSIVSTSEWNNSQEPLLPVKKTRPQMMYMENAMEAPPPRRMRNNSFAMPSINVLKSNISSENSTSQSNLKTPVRSSAIDKNYIYDNFKISNSIPRNMMPSFPCEDEVDSNFCNDVHLANMKRGTVGIDSAEDWRRISELQRRNTLYMPHLRSTYEAEMQFKIMHQTEDEFRLGNSGEQFTNLAIAAEKLTLDSPHGYNLRKRKSTNSLSPSLSSCTSDKKTKRLTPCYSRPGPPTPAKPSTSRRNNLNVSQLSTESTCSRESKVSAYSLRTPKNVKTPKKVKLCTPGNLKSPTYRTAKGDLTGSPLNRKGRTPTVLLRMLGRDKSPWSKISSSESSGKKAKPPRRILSKIKAFKSNHK